MGKKKALFEIKDLIVSIACPHCQMLQRSPNYPFSEGWDKNDVAYIGQGDVICRKCHKPFPLPVDLFNLMPS